MVLASLWPAAADRQRDSDLHSAQRDKPPDGSRGQAPSHQSMPEGSLETIALSCKDLCVIQMESRQQMH